MSEDALDIVIQTPSSIYRLQWKDKGIQLLWNDNIIAHGFAGKPLTGAILREAVEKVFSEIRTMINNVLPEQ